MIHSFFALLAPAIDFFLLLAAAKLYFIGDAHWFGRIDFNGFSRLIWCMRVSVVVGRSSLDGDTVICVFRISEFIA